MLNVESATIHKPTEETMLLEVSAESAKEGDGVIITLKSPIFEEFFGVLGGPTYKDIKNGRRKPVDYWNYLSQAKIVDKPNEYPYIINYNLPAIDHEPLRSIMTGNANHSFMKDSNNPNMQLLALYGLEKGISLKFNGLYSNGLKEKFVSSFYEQAMRIYKAYIKKGKFSASIFVKEEDI